MLFQVFNAVSAIYIYCLFFGAFSEKREFKFRNVALIGLAIIWSTVLIFIPASTVRSVLIILMIIGLSFTYCSIWYKNILLSLLVFCLPGLIEVFVGMAFLALGINVSQIDENTFLIIGTLISKLLTFALVCFLTTGKHKFGNISVWYYITFSLLSLCFSLVAIIILDYIYLNNRLHMNIIAMISVWLLAGSSILIFFVIDRINNLHIAEQNLFVSQKLLKEQKLHYEDIIEEQKYVAKIRHDIKNSLIGILAELNNDNHYQAREKLNHMFEDINNSNSEILCSDIALNTILTIKKNDALQKGIGFTCESHMSSVVQVDSIDLCVILGNALDNAIEACENTDNLNPKISIFISSQGSNFIISVKNTVSKRIAPQALITTKPDKKHHGFGISRIKELVEQYDGNININCDDEYFEINIVIVNE